VQQVSGNTPSPCVSAPVQTPGKDFRKEKLEYRLGHINSLLAQPDLPPRKRDMLTKKKEFIQAKMAMSADESKPCMDRTQFWQMRLNHINAALEHPDLSQQRRDNLTKKKEFLQAKLANPADKKPQDRTEFLQMRLAHINSKLADPSTPSHKVEWLSQKKARLEAKLNQTLQDKPWKCGSGHFRRGHFSAPASGPIGNGFAFGSVHPSGCHPHFPGHGAPVGFPPAPHGLGGHPSFHHHPGFQPHHPHHPHGFSHHPPQYGGPYGAGCGMRGKSLEEKINFISQVLQTPGLPPHKQAHLTQKKAILEAKLANQTEKGERPCRVPSPEKAELFALRQAVGLAKVNLRSARQNGLKDAELAPFIDAVANAKAALVKRRLQLKGNDTQF